MNESDVAPMVMAMTLFLSAAAVLILRGPVGKALARRLEGTAGTAPELEARVHELEQRLASLEHERAELQERVDFAERVLLELKEAPKELGR